MRHFEENAACQRARQGDAFADTPTVARSVRVDAIHAGINHDLRAIDIDATYVLQNVAKLQASIGAIHEQRTFPHSTRETTLRVQRFLEIAAACVQSQRDEIKSKSTGTGMINKYYNAVPASMQAKYICDVPAVSEDATITIAPSPEGKGSCVMVVDQAKGNKRILRFDENHKQGLDLKAPPHWFGGWTRCSPDGTLVLRCDDETFSIFSLTKRLRLGGGDCGCMIHIKHRHRHKLWKGDSVFSPDSKRIGLAFSSAVDSTRAHDRFWKVRVLGVSHDRTKLEEVGNVKGHLLLPGQQMARLAFSPDGSRLATVSWKLQAENEKVPGPATAFAVWDIASGACLNVVQAPLEMTETLYLKPRAIRILEWNGRWVLSAWLGRTGRLVIWDINAAKIILDRNLHFLPGLAKDNAQVGVAARGTDIIIGRAVMGSIQVWNAMRGQMLCVAQDADRMHHQPFLSPDGRYLVGRSEEKGNNTKTGMTSTCRVWQLLV